MQKAAQQLRDDAKLLMDETPKGKSSDSEGNGTPSSAGTSGNAGESSAASADKAGPAGAAAADMAKVLSESAGQSASADANSGGLKVFAGGSEAPSASGANAGGDGARGAGASPEQLVDLSTFSAAAGGSEVRTQGDGLTYAAPGTTGTGNAALGASGAAGGFETGGSAGAGGAGSGSSSQASLGGGIENGEAALAGAVGAATDASAFANAKQGTSSSAKPEETEVGGWRDGNAAGGSALVDKLGRAFGLLGHALATPGLRGTLLWLLLLLMLAIVIRSRGKQRWALLLATPLMMFAFMVASPISVPAEVSPSNEHEPSVWFTEEAMALAAGRVRGVPVFIDFGAAWCEACQRFDREVLSDAEVRRRLESFVVLKLDVTDDTAPNRERMSRYGVEALPTLVLVDSQGNVTRQRGAPDKTGFMRFLDGPSESRSPASQTK